MIRRLVLAIVVTIGLAGCASSGSPGAPGSPTPQEEGPPTSAPTTATGDPAAIGRAFVEAIAAGDFAAAEAMEDPTMRAAAPAAALGQLWSQLAAQLGAFESFGEATTADQAPYVVVTVPARFATVELPLLVTVDADGRVAGLHTGQPVPIASPGTSTAPSASPTPASYVDPAAFTDTDVTVGAAPWALPGTLSMPAGSGPFPAVVLLAGSGPQDRDETIGPNAPLRDLAGGLASQGIAVLRYDKRTKVHASEMAADAASVTVREEVVDDAVAAVDLLRATPGIDPERVFVVGHSLGGHLAPRVAAAAPGKVAGIALLEANSSPLTGLILDQYEHLASIGVLGADADAQLATIRAQVALAESPELSTSTPASSLPLGVPAAYWLDLRDYDPLATVGGLAIPVFISQGGRDYQVPPTELAAWREALAGRTDVTIREYPALNHLLMAGEGTPSPAEYDVAGHVDAAVVADLVAWALGA